MGLSLSGVNGVACTVDFSIKRALCRDAWSFEEGVLDATRPRR